MLAPSTSSVPSVFPRAGTSAPVSLKCLPFASRCELSGDTAKRKGGVPGAPETNLLNKPFHRPVTPCVNNLKEIVVVEITSNLVIRRYLIRLVYAFEPEKVEERQDPVKPGMQVAGVEGAMKGLETHCGVDECALVDLPTAALAKNALGSGRVVLTATTRIRATIQDPDLRRIVCNRPELMSSARTVVHITRLGQRVLSNDCCGEFC